MIQSATAQITHEVLRLIAGIDEFKGAWRALSTLAPDRLLALRRVATIESIGSSTRIEGSTLSDREVERLMTELVTWYNEARSGTGTDQLHPLLLIGIWVVVFLEIHPFQDGNGRLCRVLTTLLLLQAGYAHVPYSSLESVIEKSKEAYYLGLRQTQGTLRSDAPNWHPWLIFFLRALAEQVRRLQRKVEREKLVLAALPELSLQIVEFTREHGRITMADAIRLTGSNRNTLKQHLRALAERSQLVQRGAGRGVWYELQ